MADQFIPINFSDFEGIIKSSFRSLATTNYQPLCRPVTPNEEFS